MAAESIRSRRPLLAFIAVAAFAAIIWYTSRPPAPPPIFAHKSIAEALAAVRGTDRVLVVKATASWCPPCREMDRTTWRDPAVVSWFNEYGLVIAIDSDNQGDQLKPYRIMALPTMIAFRGDIESGRLVGFADAQKLLAWVESIRLAGK